VIAFLNAVNAVRPLTRRVPLSLLSFFAAWPTTEFPLHVLSTNVAWAAARRRLGVMHAAAVPLLLVAHVRTRRARPVLEDALSKAGIPARDDDAPAAGRSGLWRTLRVRRRYAHDAGVAYGPDAKRNVLDLWRRADLARDGAAPVLLQVPGGAWISGNKQGQAYPLLGHLAEQGWLCAAMSYRLSPRATWPAMIVDVMRAIAWLRANAARYGGDPSFIAITGGSAGGHLSALAALSPNDPAFQPGFEDADTTVQAAVSLYGIYDWADLTAPGQAMLRRFLERVVVRCDDTGIYRDASPIHRVGGHAPPFMLLHGDCDMVVPSRQSFHLAEALRAVSRQPVVHAELPGATHGFDTFGSRRAEATAAAVGEFLETARMLAKRV
jgi:acetyl esterase/lipase